MVQRARRDVRCALIELARLHPYGEPVGNLWKNPLNPRSTGRRWTLRDLEFFRRWQQYEIMNLAELATEGVNTYSPEAPVPLSPLPSST